MVAENYLWGNAIATDILSGLWLWMTSNKNRFAKKAYFSLLVYAKFPRPFPLAIH